MESKELDDNLYRLLSHLDSIKDTLPMTILLLQPYRKKASAKFEEFMEKNATEIEDEQGNKTISLGFDQASVFDQLSKNAETSNLATLIIPESLFVSLFSQYDAFLNQLLRILFKIRPEYINNSERELTFSQLVEFNSIEAARDYIVEKEVESILRKSHSDHFDYLESKLGITLKKDLPIWQTFIEITERRNLLVHCDGKVSNQYLKNCKEHKCNVDGVELNKKLRVSIDYFNKAYECLYELATKLTHTIWRKLIKNDLEEADEQLNEICYDLLTSKQYTLADILLDFGHKQTKHFNDSARNFFIVNKALSQYLQGHVKNAQEIINSKDWSASSDNFKLAHLILNEDFENAYKLMNKIGKNGDVEDEHYKTWPLFYKLRNEDLFKTTYKEIFNCEYTVLEIPKKPIQELMEDFVARNPEVKEKISKKLLKPKQNETIEAEVEASATAEKKVTAKKTKRTSTEKKV